MTYSQYSYKNKKHFAPVKSFSTQNAQKSGIFKHCAAQVLISPPS